MEAYEEGAQPVLDVINWTTDVNMVNDPHSESV